MLKIFLSILIVLVVIYIIPFVFYGVLSSVLGLKMPEGASPSTFLLSVLVSKVGTAIAFVVIFYLTRNIFGNQWLLYAGIWFVMFVFGEVSQAMLPNYSWKEAIVGIISEAMYFPMSAYILRLVFFS